jgi:hypothetical protein
MLPTDELSDVLREFAHDGDGLPHPGHRWITFAGVMLLAIGR